MELKFNLTRVKPDCKTSIELLKEFEVVEVTLQGDKDLVESVFNILRSQEPFNVE